MTYSKILFFFYLLFAASLNTFAVETTIAKNEGDTLNAPTQQSADLDEQSAPKIFVIDSIPSLFSILSSANKTINHQSLLTYEANGFITTYKLFHSINDGSVVQKLLFMDGPKRQVVRKQMISSCGNGLTRWGLWPSKISSGSLSTYTLKPIEIERIANRETLVFDIIPTDELRYGYRYSVDRRTGLILKAVTYHQDKIIERLQTISITFNDSSVALQDSLSYTWRVPELEPCYSSQFTPSWEVQWLPEGFVPVGNRLTTQGEQVLMFSDGLVSVSVFMIKNSGVDSLSKATARHGASVVVLAPVNLSSGRTVAVVGEVPSSTARKIAVSVRSLQ